MKYKICVPIPIKSLEINENAPLIKKVLDTNPNLTELRFDYINEVQFLTKDFIQSLLNCIQPKIPVIITLRKSSEGGKTNINEGERIKILKMLIEAKPRYIDIEISIDQKSLVELIHLASTQKVTIIFSYHNFEDTPTYAKANDLLVNFLKKLIKEMSVDLKIVENSIFKLVFTANSFGDNLLPLKLNKIKSSKKLKLISFCMGDIGFFSRIFCVFSGSLFTYASFEEKTAPGQMNIAEMREILKLMNFKV